MSPHGRGSTRSGSKEAVALTPSVLEEALQNASEERLAEFVADLWEATGWETRIEGTTVVADRVEGTETRRLHVQPDDRRPIERLLGRESVPEAPAGETIVAGWRVGSDARDRIEAAGAEVLDVTDLHDRLLYAIDRETCRGLCQRHLGASVDPIPRREATEDTHGGETVGDRLRKYRFTVAIAIGLLVFGLVAVGGGVPGIGWPTSADGSAGVPTAIGEGEGPGGAGGPTTEPSADRREATTTETADVRVDLEGTDRSLESFVVAETACIRRPTGVTLTFLWHVRHHERRTNATLRTAWSLIDTEERPAYAAFERGDTGWPTGVLSIFEAVRLGDRSNYPDIGVAEERIQRRVDLIVDGEALSYSIVLSRQTENREGCWLINGVHSVDSTPRPITPA